MSSLSDKEIHTQNMSSGWEHLYNIEKYMLLSCAFTSFFHFSNNSPSSPQNPFNLVQFCLCFSKLGFVFFFPQELCFQAPSKKTPSTSESLPQSERGSVVGLLVKSFQINSMRNQVLLITIMINMIMALCSKCSVSLQKYEDRFGDRSCPLGTNI